MTRHLLDALLVHASERSDAVAITGVDATGRTSLTWGGVVSEVDRTARELESLGLACDSRIVYECGNSLADVIVALACVAIGAIEIPVDSRFPLEIKRDLRTRSRAVLIDPSVVVGGQPLADFSAAFARLAARSDQVAVDRPSLVLWTSGTTSGPRGVMLSQTNLTTNAAAKLDAVEQTVDDVRLTLLSISHAYARTCDMGTWLLSGCRWTLDLGGRALGRIDIDSRPTMMNVVPTVAEEILGRIDQGDVSLARLQVLGCGGAALDGATFERLQNHGVEVIQGYGCTETSPVICSASPGRTRARCVGPPVRDCEVRMVGERLYVRGPMVMVGYLDDPESTSTKIDRDGWLDTGDLVRVEDDGQLRILGRADDVIVLPNGYKIHPAALEQAVVRACGCGRAVLLDVLLVSQGKLILAVEQADELRGMIGPTIDEGVLAEAWASCIPPGVRVEVRPLYPVLSQDRGELTAKGTVRRHVVARRFAET